MHAQNPSRRQVRSAGALYLIIITTGLSAELILRGTGLPPALSTGAEALIGPHPALRLSLLADLVMLVADVALALLFFELLAPISLRLARAAMVFRLMQAALIGVSLILLSAVPGLLAADQPMMAAQFSALHAAGYDVGLVLFGINSLLMAQLLCAAGLPRIIAAGIGLSGLVYLTGSLARLIAPALLPWIEPAYAVPMLSESALCLWLLITGRLSPATPPTAQPYPAAEAR